MAGADEGSTRALRAGEAVAHHDRLAGAGRRPMAADRAGILDAWIAALEDVREKLERGAMVALVECGEGASAILLAQAFPRSRTFGFDAHAPSMERATRAARQAGVSDRLVFETASAASWPGSDFDLVGFFDGLPEPGDLAAVARRAHAALRPGGTLVIVEPAAGRDVPEPAPAGGFASFRRALETPTHRVFEARK